MKLTKIVPLTAAICSCLSVQAQAEEVYQQEITVVTASRYEQSESDIIPSITIIDRDDILNLQANSILDLLVQQQGIDVARNGGNGTATSVFMRGTNSNHVLVLIDGVRVGSSFTGSFTWEHLPVSQIERIEIVRGTRVSYYGSDAIGGVINIITRKQDNLYARYTTGSFDTHNFDIGFGKSNEEYQYSLAVGSQNTDGFSATNENNQFAFNPDDDGYENLSINLKGTYRFDNSKLSVSFLSTKANTDFDSFFNRGNSDSSEQVGNLTWQGQVFNNWNTSVSLSNNNNTLETKIYSNDFKSDRSIFDLLLDKSFDNHHLGLGLSYKVEDGEYNNYLRRRISLDESRENIAAFGNWQGTFKKNIFSISARYDDNNIYGDNISGDISWAFKATDKVQLNLSAGSAFHAPSINDLYSKPANSLIFSPILGQVVSVFGFNGNIELKPEESINYEAGIKTRFTDTQNLSANLFYYQIDNLVDYIGQHFQPINVNESTIKGLEVAYDYSYNNLNLNINATIQDANNDETDTPLLRRPDEKLNINLDKSFDKFSIGTSIRYASKNPDYETNLDSYTVIDLRAAYRINPHWRLSAKIANAADEKYQVINGFNTERASGYLTIEWQQ